MLFLNVWLRVKFWAHLYTRSYWPIPFDSLPSRICQFRCFIQVIKESPKARFQVENQIHQWPVYSILAPF